MPKQHTSDTQPTDKQPTNAPQGHYDNATSTPQTTHNLKKYHVRFDPDTWARIQAEARQRGLSTSAMLRMIVNEWIRSESL